MGSVKNRIGFVGVVWVILLAFFSQAAALPAGQKPWEKVTPPARVIRPAKACVLPSLSAVFLAEAEELPDDDDKPFPEAALTPGFPFHPHVFQSPAGNRFYLTKRGAAIPLYLRHCLFRI
jgi:hypothetical protein